MRERIDNPAAIRAARIVLGIIVAVVVGYVWVSNAANLELVVSIVALGFVAGLVAGSWASLFGAPIALFLSGWLHSYLIACPQCPPPSSVDPTGFALAVLMLAFYAMSVGGAAAGTLASKYATRWYHPRERSPRG